MNVTIRRGRIYLAHDFYPFYYARIRCPLVAMQFLCQGLGSEVFRNSCADVWIFPAMKLPIAGIFTNYYVHDAIKDVYWQGQINARHPLLENNIHRRWARSLLCEIIRDTTEYNNGRVLAENHRQILLLWYSSGCPEGWTKWFVRKLCSPGNKLSKCRIRYAETGHGATRQANRAQGALDVIFDLNFKPRRNFLIKKEHVCRGTTRE